MDQMNTSTLVVVPCGQQKIWQREPGRGPTRAADAYTGTRFRLHRTYAERRGGPWRILSAKYGFLLLDDLLPGPYDVTFKRQTAAIVSVDRLRRQVQEQGLDRVTEVIGLGGKDYRQALESAFVGTAVQLVCPFAGMPIGKMLQAVKQATDALAVPFEPPLMPQVVTTPTRERIRAGGLYTPLAELLKTSIDTTVTLTFAQVEAVLGRPLPASARRYRTWCQ